MPRERKQRGHRHAEKRKLEREEEEKKYLESQERDGLFYDRPKNPFGLLTREDEKFFFEVYDEFKKDQWDDPDAKEAFVQNIFVEMKGKELKVATSQVGRFFEMLLAQSPKSELQRIMEIFKGHTVELAKHRFGSYALEKIAGHAGIWIAKELDGTLEEEETEAQAESVEKLFENMVGELVYPEMHELFVDPFASHVYQAILHTLNGHPQKNLTEPHASKKRKKQEGEISYSSPSSFEDLRARIIDTVKQWEPPLLQSLVFDKYAVPLMQIIIESDMPKKSKKLSKKNKTSRNTVAAILLSGKDSESEEQREFVNRLLRDAVGSRIVETILRVSSDVTVDSLFNTYFKEDITDLALDPAANFAVQRILERLTNAEDVSYCVHQILEAFNYFVGSIFEDIADLANSKISVITALLDACIRTGADCQSARTMILEEICKLPKGTDDLWYTLMDLGRCITPAGKENKSQMEETQSFGAPVSRFGALLAAAMLRLPGDNNYRMIEDFCNLETEVALFYITCPQTSHVIEYMLSTTFPVPQRRKILNHILGSVVSLATDPAGSHIIDACWNATEDIRHYREKMAREMAEQADAVRTDFFGKRVWRNWNMDAFVSERFDWGRQHGAEQRQFAKTPVVKKKPWQKFAEKKKPEIVQGLVTKHSLNVKT